MPTGIFLNSEWNTEEPVFETGTTYFQNYIFIPPYIYQVKEGSLELEEITDQKMNGSFQLEVTYLEESTPVKVSGMFKAVYVE